VRTTPQLSSVQNLLKVVQEKGHDAMRALFKDYSFVGCVNENLALVQHQTELFLCNVATLRYCLETATLVVFFVLFLIHDS
jgi:DNA mismatch repair protein MLH1